jgi:hypothetical protein
MTKDASFPRGYSMAAYGDNRLDRREHQTERDSEAAQRAVDERLLYSTDNAAVWAEEFAKVCPEVDRGLMIGWFANCAESAKMLEAKRLVIAASGLSPEAPEPDKPKLVPPYWHRGHEVEESLQNAMLREQDAKDAALTVADLNFDIDGDDPLADELSEIWLAAMDAAERCMHPGLRGFSEWCDRTRAACEVLINRLPDLAKRAAIHTQGTEGERHDRES